MQLVTGQPARGENFFPRAKEIEAIWESLSRGENILIAAPRRVGKSSILLNLKDNPRKEFLVLYIIVESADSSEEFFKKLYRALLDDKFIDSLKQFFTKSKNLAKTILDKIEEIKLTGVRLGKASSLDYYEALLEFLKTLPTQTKLILLIDEFPQVIENIIEMNPEQGETLAKQFLHKNRELRHHPELHNKVSFIYTGSIGLENVAARLNSSKIINDLTHIQIKPLEQSEAQLFIAQLLTNLDFSMEQNTIAYLINKVEYLIPFYIQLILYELKQQKNLQIVTEAQIDQAIEGMLKQRQHFEHWHSRLRTALDHQAYKYAKQILNQISNPENKSITKAEAMNLAVGFNIETELDTILQMLEHDGYINKQQGIYCFNSPILRQWWWDNVAN